MYPDNMEISDRMNDGAEICYREKVKIDNEEYIGVRNPNEKWFEASNSRNESKKISVIVYDLPEEESERNTVQEAFIQKMEKLYGRNLPHLIKPVRVVSGKRCLYVCFQKVDMNKYETIDHVLFETQISLIQRFLISVSLAAAAVELESVLDDFPIKQLNIDAILFDKKTGNIMINCEKLDDFLTEENLKKKYEEMSFWGLMPPEWYDTQETDRRRNNPATKEGFRHLLAVLEFRVMCSEDPFDGEKTLKKYPYKNACALKEMYGKDASYILNKNFMNGNNKANNYIGRRARMIFDEKRISKSLQRVFEQAFSDGVSHPEIRPSASAWLENQKKIMNWYCVNDQDWVVPDLETGDNTQTIKFYLHLQNGVILPIAQQKLICKYMLDDPNAPVEIKPIGKMYIKSGWLELEIHNKRMKIHIRNGAASAIDGMRVEIKDTYEMWSNGVKSRGHGGVW